MPLLLITLASGVGLILPNIQGMSSSGMRTLDLTYIMAALLVVFRKRVSAVINTIKPAVVKYRWLIFAIFTIALISWQCYLVNLLSGDSIWDPGIIVRTAMGRKSWVTDYFSCNPNTFMLLAVEHWFWLIFGQPNMHTFVVMLNYVNIVLIDGGIVFLALAVKNLLWSTWGFWISLIMGTLVFGITPWVSLPYSDNWAFFLSSIGLLTFVKLLNSKRKTFTIALALVLGVIVAVSYFMKPSLVIFYIAIVIVSLVALFSRRVFVSGLMILALVISLVGGGVTATAIVAYRNHNEVVKIDNNKALPMMHFAAMGIHGSGGYNRADVFKDYRIKSPRQRSASDWKLWKQRLSAFGSKTNYEKFLVQKQMNNTNDGTFAWGGDGTFIDAFEKGNANENSIRKLYMRDGVAVRQQNGYGFVAQILWVLIILLALISAFSARLSVQLMKYTVVGFCLFLLIFEGGRSRYVIQFLPFIIVLSVQGLALIIKWFKEQAA